MRLIREQLWEQLRKDSIELDLRKRGLPAASDLDFNLWQQVNDVYEKYENLGMPVSLRVGDDFIIENMKPKMTDKDLLAYLKKEAESAGFKNDILQSEQIMYNAGLRRMLEIVTQYLEGQGFWDVSHREENLTERGLEKVSSGKYLWE